MKQSVRFNLLFVLVFLTGLLVSGFFARRLLNEEVREETIRSTVMLMESAMSVRSYTIDEVQPLLSNADSFKSASVPAFAATQTFKRFQNKYPGFHYREAVLNPTNPDNLARGWEVALIEQFRREPERSELVGERPTDAGPSLYVARPIQIKNPACLVCHSTPQAAPVSLIQKYGDKGGFGWRHNELVGVQVISVPMNVPLADANRLFVICMGMYVGIFGVLLVVLNVPIKHWMSEQQQRQMELESVQLQLKALNQELAQQSTTDTLTGLKNRREFDRALLEETARLGRTGAELALLIMDVDHFKPYNDAFGHVAGDEALAQVGRILLENARANDVAVRYGGEEFAVLLPGTNLGSALVVAERIRSAIAGVPWKLRAITVSIGVAVSTHPDNNPSLVEQADQALYEAKRLGRNRVIHFDSAHPTHPAPPEH